MKIKGHESATFKRSAMYSLPMVDAEGNEVEVSIKLTGLPLGFSRIFDRDLPLPEPPEKDATTPEGHVRKDIKTGHPIKEPDWDNADFQEEYSKIKRLWTVAIVHEGLREDKKIEFETKREDFATAREFYDALLDEFDQCGFSVTALGGMAKEINRLSGIKEADIKEGMGFFSRPGSREKYARLFGPSTES